MRRLIALVAAMLALLAIVVLPPVPASADPPCPPYCPDSGTGDSLTDGRIGDWGGDYVVYCKNGFLEVWRLKKGSNQGELVAKFPLGDVANLHQQGDFRYDAKSGVTVTRWGDRIEVSGWGNGNDPFGRNSRVLKAGDCEQSGTGFKNAREKLVTLKARAEKLEAALLLLFDQELAEGETLQERVKAILALLDQAQELAKELNGVADDAMNDTEVRGAARGVAANLEGGIASAQDSLVTIALLAMFQ